MTRKESVLKMLNTIRNRVFIAEKHLENAGLRNLGSEMYTARLHISEAIRMAERDLPAGPPNSEDKP